MEAQLNRVSTRKRIQVYQNEFFSGILLLTRKLFML